jgi:hypothetical protein
MSRRAAVVFLVLLGACRLQFGKWQGAPPRASGAVRLALFTKDDRVRTAIESAWRRDPKIELTIIDPNNVPGACNEDGRCDIGLQTGCDWARGHALDYYVSATIGSSSSADFVCTKHADGSIFDKKEPECIDGYEKNQRSRAGFTVTTYDVTDCKPISTLSEQLTAYESGNAPEDRQSAEAEALAASEVRLPTFPAQVTLDASGRITGDEPGFYAIFRDRTYIGTMQVDDVRSAGKMLTCCHEPMPGDPLVRRGRVTQLSFDLAGTLTRLRVDGDQRIAYGAGLNIRHYKMDGGLEVTLTGESITAGTDHGGGGVVVGTAGWGFRPNAALRLSAHAGGGLFYAVQSRMDLAAHAVAPVAWFGGRAIFTPVPWLYIGADVGYYASAAIDDWEGDGKALADPMALRAPMARVFAGLSQ